MNPLSRSRLEETVKFINQNYPLWNVPNIGQTHHYPIETVETLRAALDALLNPEVTQEMNDAGYAVGPRTAYCDAVYKAMIQKLTEDV
jgi:hypothetical protein